MTPRVSLVINTYNRAATLRGTLRSLAWQRHPCFEVIVVNGPSTDATRDVLQEFEGRIRTAECDAANLSVSRNIGLGMAAGDIVAFTDDDAIPEPDWLAQLATAYADPRVGAAGGFIRDYTGYTYQARVVACDRFGDNENFRLLAQAEAAGAVGYGPRADRYLSPTGVNSSFRRQALLEIGGFDEAYAYFLDETDVALRLIDAGWRIAYVPTAEVHHKFAPSGLRDATRIPRSLHQIARSKAYFCIRHALPRVGSGPALEHLAVYRRERRREVAWLLEQGRIDQAHHDRLVSDVDHGTRAGVADGLRPPRAQRAAISAETGNFLRFPVRSRAERLRLCFLSREYPPGSFGGIAVWTATLAEALAARGHEISVVTRGEGHARVDFENGVWVHRVPVPDHPGAAPARMPDVPGAVAAWTLTAFREIGRAGGSTWCRRPCRTWRALHVLRPAGCRS